MKFCFNKAVTNSIGILTAILMLGISTFSSIAAADTPANSIDPSDLAAIKSALTSDDKSMQASAIAAIRKSISLNPTRGAKLLRKQWMKPLWREEQFDAIADLSLQCILAAPKIVDDVTDLMQDRINALLSLDKPEAALADAKSLYCCEPLANTDKAMVLIVLCLTKLHPDDSTAVDNFKAEQAVGAAATQPSGSATLDAILIDKQKYLEAIKQVQPAGKQPNEGMVNLLLLAGDGTQAHKILEQRLATADSDDLRHRAALDIARAIKAQYGVIGPANSWLKDYLASPTTQN
jgi:hypothetical protein